MKRFSQSEIREALAHAAGGGQALHLHRVIPCRRHAPRCFVQAVDRGEDIAHLFDQDAERLVETALRLGVRVTYIHHRGQPAQHIDLCGGPLRRAMALCEQ